MIRPQRPTLTIGRPGRRVRPSPSGEHPVTLGTLLFRQSQALDELMEAVDHPFTGPKQFDELEARATAIADGIRAAFRGRRHPGEAI